MIVRQGKRFDRHVAAAVRWGQEHHGPTIEIVRALRRLIEDLELNPGMYALAQNARTPGMRRAYLPSVHYHVYYRVNDRRGVVTLREFRHASRRPIRV